ncbi:MAG: DUF2116 family Zn-ribbon domain-containing protein [Xanthobacteraceae bacterium]
MSAPATCGAVAGCVYTRFCSAHCERIYEQERNEAAKHRWHVFLARGNSQS